MKPAEPGQNQPGLAAYMEPALPGLLPPLCPQPHGSQESFHLLLLASLGVFTTILSLNLKVAQWSEQPCDTLAPVPNLPVSLSLEEKTLTLTGLTPCLSPQSAALTFFISCPDLSSQACRLCLYRVQRTSWKTQHHLLQEVTLDNLLALLPHGTHYYSTNHSPLLQSVYMAVSLWSPSSGHP